MDNSSENQTNRDDRMNFKIPEFITLQENSIDLNPHALAISLDDLNARFLSTQIRGLIRESQNSLFGGISQLDPPKLFSGVQNCWWRHSSNSSFGKFGKRSFKVFLNYFK